MENGLLSIIVPVYNTEKWLSRCLDSILSQSYKNIELICVNDHSPDGSGKILEEYAQKDGRVVLLAHDRNRGLFRARVTGMEAAKGEYIAFVDSDDLVSCDWFRPLIEKAEREKADMTIGNTINVDEKGQKTYYNYYRSFNRNRKTLQAPLLSQEFFRQAGECFVWHTVWNKVYSATLIGKALPYFQSMPEPLIMGEDIAFSSVFYTLAQSLAFCDNDCYYYFRHSEASTSITLPKHKIVKNLEDIIQVFSFVKEYLASAGIYDKYADDYLRFKDKYYVIWSGNIVAAKLENDRRIKELFNKGFGKGLLKTPGEEELYFYEASSPYDDKLEKLKKKIVESACRYVSFDIFDTLICRPFWEPKDLFCFAASDAGLPAYYATMRQDAEAECRRLAKLADKNAEDVTLAEIYRHMQEEYRLSEENTDRFRSAEIELEYRYCHVRETGKELYSLALAVGKKIVLTSDMYIEEERVRKILGINGYDGYESIFISSKYKKLKSTGSLFLVLLKELGVSSSDVLHIGDNLHNDFEMARAAGIDAAYFPKAVDVYCNRIGDIYTGDSFKDIYCGTDTNIDSREFIKQLPLRCCAAVAANTLFDNPFRCFNHKSMYNADPYHVGYMAEGMHVLGVAHWIYKTSLRCGYDKVVFLARDGYLVKQAFDMIAQAMEHKTGKKLESSYFYATRRSLFPFIVNAPEDLLKLVEMTDYYSQTPLDILDWFADCCHELTAEKVKAYTEAGIELDRRFSSEKEFIRFLIKMMEISLDKDKNTRHKEEVSAAFKQVFAGKCATFDIGYSGRLQGIISELAEKPIDVFFIHDNGDRTSRVAAETGYQRHCFYDYSPYISGIVREIFLSELGPSCVGYCVRDGKLEFKYDDKHPLTYGERYAIEEAERGALDFCEDMVRTFGERLGEFSFRASDVSVAFENFFYNATVFDLAAFKNTWIEDKLFGGYDKRSLYETLVWYSNSRPGKGKIYVNVPFRAKTRAGRALFYFLFDRKAFFQKIKDRLKAKRKR